MQISIDIPPMLMHDIPNVLQHVHRADKYGEVIAVYNDFYKPFQATITKISSEKYDIKIQLIEDLED